MKGWTRSSKLSGRTRAFVLAAFLGAIAAAAQSGLRADGTCPTSYGSCTSSCFWWGGCGCSMVACENNRCSYTGCSESCCTSCGGPECSPIGG